MKKWQAGQIGTEKTVKKEEILELEISPKTLETQLKNYKQIDLIVRLSNDIDKLAPRYGKNTFNSGRFDVELVVEFSSENGNENSNSENAKGTFNANNSQDFANTRTQQNPAPGSTNLKEPLKTKHTYTSQEFDPESGLMYYNARFYDTDLKRFTSFDHWNWGEKLNSQTQNHYAYVLNNSLKYTDPTGKRISIITTYNGYFYDHSAIYIYNEKGSWLYDPNGSYIPKVRDEWGHYSEGKIRRPEENFFEKNGDNISFQDYINYHKNSDSTEKVSSISFYYFSLEEEMDLVERIRQAEDDPDTDSYQSVAHARGFFQNSFYCSESTSTVLSDSGLFAGSYEETYKTWWGAKRTKIINYNLESDLFMPGNLRSELLEYKTAKETIYKSNNKKE